jgi:hypothetical protein
MKGRPVFARKSPQTILQVRFWYEDFAGLLKRGVGEENWFWIAAAWAIAQEQRLDPKDGMMLVSAYFRSKRTGSPSDLSSISTIDKRTLPEIARLIELHKLPERETGRLFFDLTDALLAKTTRTFMGDDVRGGSPVPVDIWAYRGGGFVDRELLSNIERTFGAEAAKSLTVDLTEDEYQYERVFMQGFVK